MIKKDDFYYPGDEALCDPFTDGELMDEVRGFFRSYIFIKPSRDTRGKHVGWCSTCGTFIDEKMIDGFHIRGNLHGSAADCPYCGRRCTTKLDGRMRNYKSITEKQTIAYFFAPRPDVVYINVFTTAAVFSHEDPQPEILPVYKKEWYRYRLEPGRYRSEKVTLHYTKDGILEEFERSKKPVAPPVGKLDALCGTDRLAKSFLRFHQLQMYYENCGTKCSYYHKPTKYLCRFAERPYLEMCAKLGLHWVVNDIVHESKENARYVNTKAHDVSGFLRLSKQRAREYLNSGAPTKELLHLMQRFPQTSAAEAKEYIAVFHDRAESALNAYTAYGLRMGKIKSYTKAHKTTPQEYLDYIEAAEKLGLDLSVHNVLLPKNFAEAHDAAVRGVSVAEYKKMTKKQQKALEKRAKKYEWRCRGFIFRFPLSVGEIVEEGKRMSHCVGGYAARHMDGKTNIVFMRAKDAPDTPLYTIEIIKNRPIQARGYANRTTPRDDAAAGRAYALWLAHLQGKKLCFAGNFAGLKFIQKKENKQWKNLSVTPA